MNKAKFTKGPWLVCGYEVKIKVDFNDGWFPICSLTVFNEAKANANLIAAAPDMYDQIEESNDCMMALADTLASYGHNVHDLIEQVKRNQQLLAKARGEQ